MPSRIVNVANEALSTPQGQQLRGLIEGFESSLRNQPGVAGAGIGGGGQGLNPFASATAGSINSSSTAGAINSSSAASTAVLPAPDMEPLRAALAEIKTVDSPETQWNCVHTVWKMASNICGAPAEPKFRKVGG